MSVSVQMAQPCPPSQIDSISNETHIGAQKISGAHPGGTGSSGRANKPRPLKLVTPPSAVNHVSDDIKGGVTRNLLANQSPMMTMDEVLDLMQYINNAVKAGQFNSQLATQIFRLCQQLKISGECMEQSHKNELSHAFVSLRQACCRDAGQLGTPCRLKIMELVELRAMGWRPSLGYSQYYLNRNMPSTTNEYPPPQPQLFHQGIHITNAGVGQSHFIGQQQPPTAADIEAMVAGPTPVSAPPFGAIPMNPFAFGPIPTAPSSVLHQHQIDSCMTSSTNHPTNMHNTISQSAAPSHYYLIPASGATFLPQTMMPGPGMMMPPASPIAHTPGPHAFAAMSASQPTLVSGPVTVSPDDHVSQSANVGIWPKGAVMKPSPKFLKPQKVAGKNQFRDEIIIRNADSGKIMGVKGRRVAVVEELSKTIISFQKVVQGAKERTLTITGSTEESIDHAKILIEETIRRNVSPNRPDTAETENAEGEEAEAQLPDEQSESSHDLDISVVAGEGGMLKINCADPEIMQAAQMALQEAMHKFRRGPLRRSADERQLQRQRRKSVPSFSPETTDPIKAPTVQNNQQEREQPTEHTHGRRNRRGSVQMNEGEKQETGGENRREPTGANKPNWRVQQLARSTPNLTDPYNNKRDTGGTAGPKMHMRVTYNRPFMMQFADSPLAQIPPGTMPWIAKEAPEIIRQVGGHFDSSEHNKSTRI